jgi:hypothetical protein
MALGVSTALNGAVAISLPCYPRSGRESELSGGRGVYVAGQIAVFTAKRISRLIKFFDLRDLRPYLCGADEVLADEHTADNQPDDD